MPLRSLYNINDRKICYVHGECNSECESDLIIGHGNDARIKEIKQTIKLCERNDFTQRTRNEKNEQKCLLSYIQQMKKNVENCMNRCKNFYSKFNSEPEVISVYGMSLGDVDKPYFKQIRELWPRARWRFSYYSCGDQERIDRFAREELILNDTEYEMFSFNNQFSNIIQNNIIDLQEIEQYKMV